MNVVPRLAIAVILLGIGHRAAASDLEMTIRHHARRIACGDPLYVEVTIVNRGKEVVFAPTASMDLNTFRFEIRDPNSELTLWQGGGGGLVGRSQPIRYEPQKPVRHYWQTFLPPLHKRNDPFWDSVCNGESALVGGVFRVAPARASAGIELRSGWQYVRFDKPKERRFQIFDQFADDKSESSEKGPMPGDFGLALRGSLTDGVRRSSLRICRPARLPTCWI